MFAGGCGFVCEAGMCLQEAVDFAAKLSYVCVML